MQLIVLFLALPFLVLAVPSLPQAQQQPVAYKSFSFYSTPLIGRTVAVVASGEAENDEISPFAGYGEAPATSAEIPKTSDAFLIAAPTSVQFNVQPSEYKAPATPVGVAPKFTGSFKVPLSSTVQQFSQQKEAITNPAAFFMDGADISKVNKPSCRMIGCDGPLANDEDVNFVPNISMGGPNSQCHQTFVPLNGCVDGKGYPVGMMCTICCDCTASLKLEMSKSRGFKQGFRANLH